MKQDTFNLDSIMFLFLFHSLLKTWMMYLATRQFTSVGGGRTKLMVLARSRHLQEEGRKHPLALQAAREPIAGKARAVRQYLQSFSDHTARVKNK